MKRYISKNQKRSDALSKVTGEATYTHDIVVPGMLFAKVLRSPHAHARIRKLDVSKAAALPGVKAVATWENTPRKLFNSTGMMAFLYPGAKPAMDEYIFDQMVRHVGDEVAAVAATSEEIAAEAIRLIEVEYEPLPALLDPLDALEEDAILIHGDIQDNNIASGTHTIRQGDFEKGWAECDVTYEARVKLPIQKQAQLETHAAVAEYRNGELTVWSPTQSVHGTKYILAHIFDMSAGNIRVMNPPYVGGAFGVRVGFGGKAEGIVSCLSMLSGYPVKLVLTREEDFTVSDTRHSGYVDIKLGAKADGRFHAFGMNAYLNTGAYGTHGIEVAACLGNMATSTYRVPNIFFEGASIYTNIVPAGAFRGFGNPQAVFAVETAVDALAKKLDIDPVELRLKNRIRVNDEWPLSYPCSSTALDECIKQAAAKIGWSEKRGRAGQGRFRRGVGLGAGTHFCGYDELAHVSLELETDGSLSVFTGNSEIGTGHITSLQQITAESFGCEIEQVNIKYGDTRGTPYDVGCHSTRSVFAIGNAISMAAGELKEQVLQYAAGAMGCSAEALSIESGRVRGGPEEMDLGQLARDGHIHKTHFSAEGKSKEAVTVTPWEAHAAEVEVDTLTGMVKVLKVVAAHDVGVAINPQLVEGQIEGGVVIGIGYATREEMSINEKGEVYNSSYHTYMLPTFADTPEIEPVIVESYEPRGPYGAKGVGECGLVPTAAAIAAAVEDATGVRFLEIPLTPQRVLDGLQAACVTCQAEKEGGTIDVE
ncbi:molybdopterin-dependent oxidoreductase [Ruminococcaceae bacterium OttesenSCG-928-I18]|nr:molybdopterin-dependent oxidoreductase [Ruminococcaceae bacterium OttesenSCG-928-I18]